MFDYSIITLVEKFKEQVMSIYQSIFCGERVLFISSKASVFAINSYVQAAALLGQLTFLKF